MCSSRCVETTKSQNHRTNTVENHQKLNSLLKSKMSTEDNRSSTSDANFCKNKRSAEANGDTRKQRSAKKMRTNGVKAPEVQPFIDRDVVVSLCKIIMDAVTASDPSDHAARCNTAVSLGVAVKLVAAMQRHHRDIEVAKWASGAIANLAYGDDDDSDRIKRCSDLVSAGALEQLLAALAEHHDHISVVEQVTQAIWHLLNGENDEYRGLRNKFLDAGGAPHLVATLLEHHDNAVVLRNTITLIEHLARNENVGSVVIQESRRVLDFVRGKNCCDNGSNDVDDEDAST